MIGINNRDLDGLLGRPPAHLRPARRRARRQDGGVGVGHPHREQIEELERVGVDAVLVGETLMRAPDPEEAVRELTRPEMTAGSRFWPLVANATVERPELDPGRRVRRAPAAEHRAGREGPGRRAARLIVVALLAEGHVLIEDYPGRRQDRARPGARALDRRRVRARAVHRRPAARRHRRHATSTTSARTASSSAPARCSRTSCSSTRSTAPRRRRSPACSSACRSAR